MCAAIINSLNRGLILDLPLNGQVRDRSPAGNNGVKTGFTFNNGSLLSGVAWTDGKFANYNGVVMTGSPNYILLPTNDVLEPSSLTIMSWIKTGSTDAAIFDNRDTVHDGYGLFIVHPGYLHLRTNGSTVSSSTTLLNDDVWRHIAATYTNPNTTLYVNGSVDAGPTNVGNHTFDTTLSPTIGTVNTDLHNTTYTYNGNMSNFRLWNRALSAAEIGSEMNSPIAVTGSGLILALELNEGHGTIAYDTNDTVKGPWSESKAATFTSSASEYISVANETNFDFKDFSMSAWIKYSTTGATSAIINKMNNTGGEKPYAFLINTNNVAIIAVNGAGGASTATGTTLLNDNVWHFVTATYDSSNIRIYVDGIEEDSDGHTGALDNSPENLLIGARPNGPTSFFEGNISNVKVYNRALSALEVKSLYETSKGGYLK